MPQKLIEYCRKIQPKTVILWVAVQTLGFPLEHFLWHNVPPFLWVAHLMGL
jgi:hypothetical protein